MDPSRKLKRGFSEISDQGADVYWEDVRSLYSAAADLKVPISGGAAFHVLLDGRASCSGAAWFLSGSLLGCWFECSADSTAGQAKRVVVKVSEAMYQAVARHSATLRILQADISEGSSGPVIDTTSGRAVLAGARPTRQDTTLEVVEVFCGGFNGWSQGVSVLRTFGYSLCIKWMLDTDIHCFEGTRQHHPDVHKVFDQQELLQHSEGPDAVFLCASLEHVWWAQGPAITCPDIACVSPPCQPWSTGGSGSGLECPDGRLMLHLFAQLAVLQIPVVVLEQVPGFPAHRHFQAVRKAWVDAGYQEHWSKTLDLLEVAPVARRRFLMVLVRTGIQVPSLSDDWPVLPYRPTLGSFDCLLHLPPALQQACVLSEETMQIYMDPWYMPPSRHPAGRPQNPAGYRLRGPSDRAPTFLAQYHYQHELSPNVLERAGLYGSLLSWQGKVRFFSGAEIALLHCATEATWLPKDDRCQMRQMGNGISPVHAVFPLTLALRVVGPPELRISTAQALLQCLTMRLRASSLSFLEFPEGWVICPDGKRLQAFIAVFDTWQPRQCLPSPVLAFRAFALRAAADECLFVLAPDISLDVALQILGQVLPEECLEQLLPQTLPLGSRVADLTELTAEACLEVDIMPSLPLPLQPEATTTLQQVLVATGRDAYYFLDRDGQHFLWELSQVMGFEGWGNACFFEVDRWFTAEGQTVMDRQDLRGAVSFRIVDPFSSVPFQLNLEQLGPC